MLSGFISSFVDSVNKVNSQWIAIIVMLIGVGSLIGCKQLGIDTTIAGGIIGVAGNMLQNQIKQDLKAAHVENVIQNLPAGSSAGKD